MKRRNFFGALLAGAAAFVVAPSVRVEAAPKHDASYGYYDETPETEAALELWCDEYRQATTGDVIRAEHVNQFVRFAGASSLPTFEPMVAERAPSPILVIANGVDRQGNALMLMATGDVLWSGGQRAPMPSDSFLIDGIMFNGLGEPVFIGPRSAGKTILIPFAGMVSA